MPDHIIVIVILCLDHLLSKSLSVELDDALVQVQYGFLLVQVLILLVLFSDAFLNNLPHLSRHDLLGLARTIPLLLDLSIR